LPTVVLMPVTVLARPLPGLVMVVLTPVTVLARLRPGLLTVALMPVTVFARPLPGLPTMVPATMAGRLCRRDVSMTAPVLATGRRRCRGQPMALVG
jgi:hypothetical protein